MAPLVAMSSSPEHEKEKEPSRGREKKVYRLQKAVPGVRQLKRRLTDPGLAVAAADVRRMQRQRTEKRMKKNVKNGSKEVGDESKAEQSEEFSEVPEDRKPKRLCPKDNIGEEYLLEIKPEESLIKTRKDSPKPSAVASKESSDSGYDEGFKIIDLGQERKRQMIISEMMQTEKTYLDFLQTVVMLFIIPLQKSLEKDSEPLLTEEQIELVFQNIEEIKLVNGVRFLLLLYTYDCS